MLVPCEVAVKCLLPAVRSMLAKELMVKHGLKQTDVAKRLGVSQPAISLYRRKIRGKAIDLENDAEVEELIEKLAAQLAKDGLSHTEFIQKFCEICKTIRAKGLLCKLHEKFDPTINGKKCGFCLDINALECMSFRIDPP
jgi:predicted transcriptional regulator